MTILKDFYLNCVAFPLGGLEESIDHIFEVTIDGLSLMDNVDINILNEVIEIKFKENLQIASNQELKIKLKSEK